MKKIAIVHYNTPELTEACILSLRKTGCFWPVIVFDNSDKRPFCVQMPNVHVLNNTGGLFVDFEAELAKYPDRSNDYAKVSNYGSVKHMLSVQKLWELEPGGFILLDSDILLKKSITWLWDENFAACGKVQYLRRVGRREHDRLAPMCLYMNVPLLTKHGARFFDPMRSWWLQPGSDNDANWWDTGACLLDDIRKTKPELVAKCWPRLEEYYAHYGSGSWRRTDVAAQLSWLNTHRNLWAPNEQYKLGKVEGETNGAKIFVCTHKDFIPHVKHPVYEIADARDINEGKYAMPGLFYSEFMTYDALAQPHITPKVVGFCHYRKYFDFMDNVPQLDENTRIVSKRVDLKKPMREQYADFGNVADIDLCTAIIDKKHKDFAPAWHQALESSTLHPCSMFIMPRKEFRAMVRLVFSILDEWVNRAGDIEQRIKDNPEAYHLKRVGYDYALRIGGQLGERIVSAWIDWKMPDAQEIPIRVFPR